MRKENNFNTELLRIFISVAETGSFSQTARLLGKNQSTISRSVQKLEELFQTKLFERRGNSLVLTLKGLRIRDKVTNTVDTIDSMISEARINQGYKLPALRFASSTSFSRAISSDLVNALIGPIKNIATFTGNTPEVIEMLENDFVEVAIATSNMIDNPEVNYIPLYKEKFLAVLPKSVDGSIIDLHDLIRYAKAHPCIQFHRQTQDWLHTSRVLRQWGVLEGSISLSTIESIIQLVEKEGYWALMPALNIWGANTSLDSVAFKFLSPQQGYRTSYLLYKQDYLSAVVQEIISVTKITMEQKLIPKFTNFNKTLGEAVELL